MRKNSDFGSPLLGIQYLRGVAALMVAYFHLGNQLPIYAEWMQNHAAGSLNFATGVDIFFVVSGFIMVISSANETPWKFMEKRLIRIIPLYWAVTLFVVMGYLLIPEMFRTAVVTLEYLAKSLFFIPYRNPGHDGDLVPILVPGWSLNFEMAFYVVFAVSLWLPVNRRVIAVGTLFLILLVLKSCFPQGSLWISAQFYIVPRLIEFWLGMVIGEMVRRDTFKPINHWVYWILAAVSLIVLLVPESTYISFASKLFSEIAVVLASGALVFCVVGLEKQGWVSRVGWLKRLGDASYSVYLSHLIAFGIIREIWVRLGADHGGFVDAIGFIVVSMVFVVAVGQVLFLYLEKPLLNHMRKMISPARAMAIQ